MKTSVTKKSEITRKWYIIDAEDKILGKVAVEATNIIRGKNKSYFSPAVDAGDFVIIINASKVKVSGGKEEKKMYYRHSWYPGGLKQFTFRQMMEKDPRKVIEHAVKGMLPKNRLASEIFKKLKVYNDAEHKHEAQQPEKIDI